LRRLNEMWRAICKELKWPFYELYNNDSYVVPEAYDDNEWATDFGVLEPDSEEEYASEVADDEEDFFVALEVATED
jgi:hypothetical protein